jgi:hypothetical protein
VPAPAPKVAPAPVAAAPAPAKKSGGDDALDDEFAALFAAEGYARSAAAQNDDYIRLSDAVTALTDSFAYGSEAMANTAWGTVANICNSL